MTEVSEGVIAAASLRTAIGGKVRDDLSRRGISLLIVAFALASFLGAAPARAQNAYITNSGANTVSVVPTTTGSIVTAAVGRTPVGVAVTPDGSQVYVTNNGSSNVSVIAAANNTVTATVSVGGGPFGVAVTPDGSKVYVANGESASVSVISTASNTVIATIPVGYAPTGVAVTPDGGTVYVANQADGTVSVIATASNTVTARATVGSSPEGVAVSPDGSTVYVANSGSNTVSVIAAATNTVTGTITVGSSPFGVAVTPDGSAVYVANEFSNSVSVIATTSDTVVATVAVGNHPFGAAVTPDGGRVYVANLTDSTVSVIATASKTVTYTIPVGYDPLAFGSFIGPALTVTVAAAGSGGGQVVSRPTGIDCGAGSNKCAAPFTPGTGVILTATAAAGSTFAGWSGGGCSGTGTCSITMSADTGVTASFAAEDFTLSVSTIGRGTVKSSPAGIDCGPRCSCNLAAGAEVRLRATPASGWEFHEWRGACAGRREDDCHVTMDAAESVMARFREE